nr:HEAT repeat domain-containing protein [Anaerolineae bacterium]
MSYDVNAVIEELTSQNWANRLEAVRRIEVLGAEHSQATAPALVAILQADDSQHVRASAARVLGVLACPFSVEGLIQALDDKSPHVRLSAIWALGQIGGAAEPALLPLARFTGSQERLPGTSTNVAEVAQATITLIEQAVDAERGIVPTGEARKLSEECLAKRREAAEFLARLNGEDG